MPDTSTQLWESWIKLQPWGAADSWLAPTAFTNWSRAYGHIARGVMAASVAQMDLARSLYTHDAGDTPAALGAEITPQSVRHWLNQHETKMEHAIKTCRRINDELLSSFFQAADSLIEPTHVETTVPQTDIAPASAQAVVTPLAKQSA